MKHAGLVALLGVLTVVVPSAQPATRALPAPAFSVPGQVSGVAAAGYRVAVSTSDEGCVVVTAQLGPGRKAKPVPVRVGSCGGDFGEGQVYDVWLGRSVVGAAVYSSPSPHGEHYWLRQGPLPRGPLKLLGDEWGWTDSSDTYAFGCEWVVTAGGGVTAAAATPNRFGVEAKVDDEVTCPGDGTTEVKLTGAPRAELSIQGSWMPVATDAKRLVLSRLDPEGLPAGELAYFGLDGKRVAGPPVASATAKVTYRGWLVPEGLVLLTKRGLVARGWTVPSVLDAAVAYGRVFYVRGRAVHVRRIRDGRDRVLLTLPKTNGEKRLAAGSFGLAVALDTGGKTSVYRIGWSTIDGVLPAR